MAETGVLDLDVSDAETGDALLSVRTTGNGGKSFVKLSPQSQTFGDLIKAALEAVGWQPGGGTLPTDDQIVAAFNSVPNANILTDILLGLVNGAVQSETLVEWPAATAEDLVRGATASDTPGFPDVAAHAAAHISAAASATGGQVVLPGDSMRYHMVTTGAVNLGAAEWPVKISRAGAQFEFEQTTGGHALTFTGVVEIDPPDSAVFDGAGSVTLWHLDRDHLDRPRARYLGRTGAVSVASGPVARAFDYTIGGGFTAPANTVAGDLIIVHAFSKNGLAPVLDAGLTPVVSASGHTHKVAVGWMISTTGAGEDLGTYSDYNQRLITVYEAGSFDAAAPVLGGVAQGIDTATVDTVSWPVLNGFARPASVGVGAIYSEAVAGGPLPGSSNITWKLGGYDRLRAMQAIGGWPAAVVPHHSGIGNFVRVSYQVQAPA